MKASYNLVFNKKNNKNITMYPFPHFVARLIYKNNS